MPRPPSPRCGGTSTPASTRCRGSGRRVGRDPQWVDDAGFDVARHVHGMTLAAPGGAGELRALAGRLLGRPLDLDRPLWRMTSSTDSTAGASRSSARRTTRWSTASPRSRSRCCSSTASQRRDRRVAPAARRPGAARVARPASPARRGPCGGALRARRCPRGEVRARRRGARPGPRRTTALDRSLTHRREVAFATRRSRSARGRAQARRHGQRRRARSRGARARRRARRRGDCPRPSGARPGQHAHRRGRRPRQPHRVPRDRPAGRRARPARGPAPRARRARRAQGAAARPAAARAGPAADLLPAAGRRAVARAAARAAAFNVVVSNVPGPPRAPDAARPPADAPCTRRCRCCTATR